MLPELRDVALDLCGRPVGAQTKVRTRPAPLKLCERVSLFSSAWNVWSAHTG